MAAQILDFPSAAKTADTEPTPLQLLEAFVEKIEKGELSPTGIFIGMVQNHPADPELEQVQFFVTGLSTLEQHGVLSIMQREVE